MNYKEAAIYADKPISIVKQEFGSILEAFEDSLFSYKLSKELVDFWLHGSLPVNYHGLLTTLKAKSLLLQAGVPIRHLSTVLFGMDVAIDHYTLFKNVCLHHIGEELTPDFQTFVIEPIQKLYVEPRISFEKMKKEEQKKADIAILNLTNQLKQSIKELESLNKSAMAATVQETLKIELIKLDFMIEAYIPKSKK